MKPLILTILVLTLCCAWASFGSAQQITVTNETLIPGYHLPHARDLVVDDQNCVFVIGSAYTDGIHLDVILIKLDPAGNPLWDLYIDGGNHDYATGLALDSAGDVWVCGWTDSPDFPMVNAMDDTLTGFRDAFLMKVDTDEGSILYSTFIGGDYSEICNGIVISNTDEIYLTGNTGSTDFPVTEDAYQYEPNFPLYFFDDAFIMRLSPEGNEIRYSTRLGGTMDDTGDRIALDAEGNILVAGHTSTDDFPLVEALDEVQNDLFIFKLSADGSTALFSTYFGGSDLEILRGMVSDELGNVYLTGSTRSIDFPTTAGSFQENFVGDINGCNVPFGGDYNCEDFFVSKVSTTGDGLVWSTYIGGNTVDEPRSIAVGPEGNVYVAGYTTSEDFPQGEIDFGAEIVVCKLSNDGGVLDFTHSIDSGSANRGNGVTVDSQGSIYFSGTVGVQASIYVSKLEQGDILTGLGDVPGGLLLQSNYPNPFNPATNITYSLPESGGPTQVTLNVFDVRGNLVSRLVNERQQSGVHTVSWHGQDQRGLEASAGVYFYQLNWGAESLTRSMVLLK